ncbi:MAG: patatin-like phospholipase family protein [Gammaproteobacteria bacterium]
MNALPDERAIAPVAVILPGGGARGAYQAGVLDGIASLYGPDDPVPFQIIAGTSAGAMNAAYLASRMDSFVTTAAHLCEVWANISVGQVYQAGYGKLIGVMLRWLWAFASGGRGASNPPRALLDNTPLRKLLDENIDFSAIQTGIDKGLLHGLAITVAGYASERALTYFQAAGEVEPWWRERREGRPAKIALDHVMASLALPIIFPATKIDGEWCGDGSTRQFAPLSPSVHLGAERLLIIDVQHPAPSSIPHSGRDEKYPSLSRVMGYLLDAIFSDSLHSDLERLERVNQFLEHLPPAEADPGRPLLRSIETMMITPSSRPVRMAARHLNALPKGIRWLLRSVGGEDEGGSLLLSYMLFEAAYCRELIELGRSDALMHGDELRSFLGIHRTRSV